MFKYTITKGYTVLDLSSVNLKIKYILQYTKIHRLKTNERWGFRGSYAEGEKYIQIPK